MKIEKEKIKKYVSVLSDIEFIPTSGKYLLFFPINQTTEKDIGGFTLHSSDDNARKNNSVGLLLPGDGTSVKLAYADISYAIDFNVLQYCELMNIRLGKKDEDMLSSVDCYLVQKDYIYAAFDNDKF